MATSTQSPNDLTRQQLDELDDLLQRMLSLPLNPPESFSNAPPAQAFAAPLPTPAPPPVVREAPAPAPAPRVFAPRAPEPVEPSPAWQPAFSPPPPPAPMPAPIIERPVPAPAFEWPAAASAKTIPAAPAYVPPAPEPVSFLYAPFVALNAILNWVLGLFGFPGRVLRSGFVKSLFGLAGLGLLAYTGLKVAQIHGLVVLPQELPWPR